MRTINKYMIMGAIYITAAGIFMHFLYDWTGKNPLIGLFAPVNESTWEHIKLLFFPAITWALYTNLQLKSSITDILPSLLLGILVGCFAIPVLFYTYTGILGFPLLLLDILVFFAAIGFMFFTISKTISSTRLPHYNKVLILCTILLLISFLLFTFCPPKLGIFALPSA